MAFGKRNSRGTGGGAKIGGTFAPRESYLEGAVRAAFGAAADISAVDLGFLPARILSPPAAPSARPCQSFGSTVPTGVRAHTREGSPSPV